MKADELRQKSVADLKALLETMMDEQFKLKMQHQMGQLDKAHKLKVLRRDVARVMTVLTQMTAEVTEV